MGIRGRGIAEAILHWPEVDSKTQAKMRDFKKVLFYWGIRENEVDDVIRMCKRQIWLTYLPILLLSFVLLGQGRTFPFFVLLVPGGIGIFNRLWRISILRQRQYIPFLRWFIGKEA